MFTAILISHPHPYIIQFFEIALPVVFICILLAIKNSLEGSDGFSPEVVPALLPNDTFTVIPLSFRDYVTSLQVERICEPTLSLTDATTWEYQISGYYDNQNPFLKCDRRLCRESGQNATDFCEHLILALAPQDSSDERGLARAESFRAYVNLAYPEVVINRTIDYPFVQMFGSDSEIAAYVKDESYGKSGSPKIGFAVTFPDGSSEKDYVYTLRMNSTNFNQPEQQKAPAQSTTPETNRDFSLYSKTDNACTPVGGTASQGPMENSCTGQYLYNGAITVQRTLQDWILVDSGSKAEGMFVAEHGVQFVMFPTQEYTINGFYAVIAGEDHKQIVVLP